MLLKIMCFIVYTSKKIKALIFIQIIKWKYGNHIRCGNSTSSHVHVTIATNNEVSNIHIFMYLNRVLLFKMVLNFCL